MRHTPCSIVWSLRHPSCIPLRRERCGASAQGPIPIERGLGNASDTADIPHRATLVHEHRVRHVAARLLRMPGWAPALLATGAGDCAACGRAFLPHPPFALRQRGTDGAAPRARRRRRLQSPITQRPNTPVSLAQRLPRGHPMRPGPPQAVQPPHHQRIARFSSVAPGLHAGAGRPRPRRSSATTVAVPASGTPSRGALQPEVLLHRPDAGVADQAAPALSPVPRRCSHTGRLTTSV
jgi:hypothetical protein